MVRSRAAALTPVLAVAALVAAAVTPACESQAPAPPPLVDVGALRAKVSACAGVDAAAAFSFFFPESLGGVADAHDCVAAAVDCPAVLACAGYQSTGCSPADDRCDGGAAFACQGLPSGLYAARTTVCMDDPAGDDTCSIADDAKYGLGAFCHGAACTGERCDGDAVVRCRGGFDVHIDCRAQGLGCAEYQGQAFCAYDELCTTDRCTGDTIEICNGGRVTLRARCDELVPGTTCSDRKGRVECAAHTPSTSCSSSEDFEGWCDSGLAVTCLGGVRIEADCGALPDGACQAGVDMNGATATCVTAAPL